MRKKIFGLFLNIALIFSCVFPLAACGRKISTSERQLYVTACNAVNKYAANTSIENNIIFSAFNSSQPLKCSISDIDDSSAIANSLVVTNVRSLSKEGPLTVTVTFKAPINGKKNTNALISVLLAFKAKDDSVNRALSEYIFCTTKYTGGDSSHVCNDYTYSDKAAFTPSKVAEVVKKADYQKNTTTHGSVAPASPNNQFNFLENGGITLVNSTINFEGKDRAVYDGVLSIALDVNLDDTYVGNESNLSLFCDAGLSHLYSSISTNGSAYTYLDTAFNLLTGKLGYTSLTPETLGKTKINFVLNEEWIAENANSNSIFMNLTVEGADGSITYYKGSCNYTVKVFNTSGAFSTPMDDYITFGKIENDKTGTVSWYLWDESMSWNDKTGFVPSAGTEIINDVAHRCPNPDRPECTTPAA